MKYDIRVGDKVEKIKGYPFPGVVQSIFKNSLGQLRAVVEADHDEFKGMLHIFDLSQLKRRNSVLDELPEGRKEALQKLADK